MIGKDMLSPREVAKRTGIGINAIYLMLQRGEIPSMTVGSKSLIPRPQYEHWLETVKGSFQGAAQSRNERLNRLTPAQHDVRVKNLAKARASRKANNAA